jgi:hypothetical protein
MCARDTSNLQRQQSCIHGESWSTHGIGGIRALCYQVDEVISRWVLLVSDRIPIHWGRTRGCILCIETNRDLTSFHRRCRSVATDETSVVTYLVGFCKDTLHSQHLPGKINNLQPYKHFFAVLSSFYFHSAYPEPYHTPRIHNHAPGNTLVSHEHASLCHTRRVLIGSLFSDNSSSSSIRRRPTRCD